MENPSSSKADICVVGLGYIGLPTASMFAAQGFDVLGVDVSAHVVEIVNEGKIHIEEPGLRTLVSAAVKSGQLRAARAPQPAKTFIIAVPTPCRVNEKRHDDRSSDLSYVDSAVEAILPVLEEGDLVILESTSPPKTTVERVAKPLVEAGFTPGEDVFVAHCPERVLPGHILRELTQNDRVIGGITMACAQRAARLYASVVEGQIHQTNATTAELVKLMENTFRDVNIALANELAGICDHLDVDVTRVIELANCHPRVNLHQPGPGVGGHCLPLDPWFVIESAPEQARLIREARLLNQAVPRYLVHQIKDTLELGNSSSAKLAIFGVAYKGNVDDARESPGRDFVELLEGEPVDVAVYDPHVRHFEHELVGLQKAVQDADAIVITAAHDEFKFIDPSALIGLMRGHHVFDFCNLLDAKKWRSAGFTYVGRGVSPQAAPSHAESL
ncbi:nucleotide sugar dehydrogenase [Persicimonas caeni]|uniref:Nucleotide sugar dehydrogenase n=1 Tax=Persicimonas caeni TaxID=2292766 RepID=A0A4Y6PTS1_PERCE|nr:nucleotide sugar dehydrogenase [Persicimonas caeni]QDG51698.1 nucleotide sugar dehydrogenase [Persicimonas caeni]QED32919.1 nucleotide sugar dehydrogenase [Persicimonas caeni]